MWFDGVIVDADTTEDQSGQKHDKVNKTNMSCIGMKLLCCSL